MPMNWRIYFVFKYINFVQIRNRVKKSDGYEGLNSRMAFGRCAGANES